MPHVPSQAVAFLTVRRGRSDEASDAAELRARIESALESVAIRIARRIGLEYLLIHPDVRPCFAGLRDLLADLHGLGIEGRAAISVGPVIEVAGELYGDTVNIAARIFRRTEDGELTLTGDTALFLADAIQLNLRFLDERVIRGRSDTTQIFVWRCDTDVNSTLTEHDFDNFADGVHSRLVLQFAGTERVIDRKVSECTIGRHRQNDMVWHLPGVSRRHATVRNRGGYFVLEDHSTYGTFLHQGGGVDHVHRRTVPLEKEGKLAITRNSGGSDTDAVTFRLERT